MRRSSARQANWLAVNQQLTPVAAPQLTLEWVERKYLSVLTQQPDEHLQYVSRLKETVRNTRSVQIAAGGSNFAIPTQEPGDFILVLRNSAGAELNRLSYTVAGEANISRSLDRNAELQIQLDKPAYSGGDTISVSIRAPYAGAGLITVERERIFHHQWFKTSTTSSVQRVTLPAGFEGNGYVAVEFLRDPASDEIFMSPLSYGVAPFAADLAERTQTVRLSAPAGQAGRGAGHAASRLPKPRAWRCSQWMKVSSRWRVTRIPIPSAYFFQKRMLQVETTQILDLMLPEFRRFLALAAPGGDAGRQVSPATSTPSTANTNRPSRGGRELSRRVRRDASFAIPSPIISTDACALSPVAVNTRRAGVAEADTEVKGDFILTPNVPAYGRARR